MAEVLLEVENLSVEYRGPRRGVLRGPNVRAVDGISFGVERGTTLGLVGESGSGKTTTGRAILGLTQPASGNVIFEGQPLPVKRSRLPLERRRELQVVFQNPYSSMNPMMRVADIVAEPMFALGHSGRRERRAQVGEWLERVGLSPSDMHRYPADFSGGQRQRIAIARALAARPKLLVLDEPVSALDMSTQAQVINLLKDIQRDLHVSYLLIAHDLMVVHNISHAIAVMFSGRIVESGEPDDVLRAPQHPYTQRLVASIPTFRPSERRERDRERDPLGSRPTWAPPTACAYIGRCDRATQACAGSDPPLHVAEPRHHVLCHHPRAESAARVDEGSLRDGAEASRTGTSHG